MRTVDRFGMIAVLAVGMAVAPAFAGDVTVGHFYTEIAQAKRLVSSDSASAEANLRGAGFNLPELALEKSLTEGDMASISSTLGLAVTTERPSQLISESQMNTFMASFGSQIGAPKSKAGAGSFQTEGDGTGGTDPGNSGNGKGQKKGHNKSRSEPDDDEAPY
jgi:hypothetical protein